MQSVVKLVAGIKEIISSLKAEIKALDKMSSMLPLCTDVNL